MKKAPCDVTRTCGSAAMKLWATRHDRRIVVEKKEHTPLLDVNTLKRVALYTLFQKTMEIDY